VLCGRPRQIERRHSSGLREDFARDFDRDFDRDFTPRFVTARDRMAFFGICSVTIAASLKERKSATGSRQQARRFADATVDLAADASRRHHVIADRQPV